MSNKKVLEEGLKKAREIAFNHLEECLIKACEQLVDDAVSKYKSPIGPFTGNTITSYAIGLYIDGKLHYYYSNDGIKSPVRRKLRAGEKVYLEPDWMGGNREFTGRVDTDGGYGEMFSYDFLMAYRSNVKSGIELVMTTGTEYSSYIETAMNGNVLTDTFKRAGAILSTNLKPM